jgi:MFS family permease
MQDNEGIKQFQVGGTSARRILIVCSLLYMMNYMDRAVLSAVLEPLRLDLGLNDTRAGVLGTIFMICIALFSFPVAFLVDRWSRRKAVGIMAITWSVFTYITGLGRSFIGVIIPRALVAVGESGFSSGGTAMIAVAYPVESRSRVMSIFNLSIPLGGALGVILAGYLSAQFGGWRTPFFVFAIPGIILGIAAFFLKDYKTADELDNSGKRRGFISSAVALFRIPTLKWFYIGFGMRNLMAFSVMGWTVAYVMRSRGIAEDRAGLILGIVSLMAIVGAPLGGFLADLWQKRNSRGRMYVPAIADLLGAAVAIGAFALDLKAIGFVLFIIWGMLATAGLPSLSSVSQDVVTPGLKGMAWGMAVLCMYLLGGAWGPLLVGKISDALGGGAEGLRIALMIASTGGFIGGFLFLMGARFYPKDMEMVRDITLEAE